MKCTSCPRKCSIERNHTNSLCGVKEEMLIGRIGKHFFEEPPISGTNGSGTIFFCGCPLKCVYCQNQSLTNQYIGKVFSANELSQQIRKLESLGVHNINFVTPTHYYNKVIETLSLYKPIIPIVYNCSGYETIESILSLKNYVDIYLPDFKYADNAIAFKYSNVKDYKEVCIKAISEMLTQKPNIFEGSILKQGVIIRHLILPNNLENSKKVLDTIKDCFGNKIILSLMSQYTPVVKTNFEELNRTLKSIEYKIIVKYAEKLGFENVFIQELSSADDCFIPEFYNFENGDIAFL